MKRNSENWISQLARPKVLEMKPYRSARDDFQSNDNNLVFMDANEDPLETDVNRYPDPLHDKLRTLLAAQKNVDPKSILLGNGSDEMLDLIFRVFCEPGKDRAMVLPPTYGMYGVLASLNDVTLDGCPLDSNFQPVVSQIQALSSNSTKLLFLCSPNNPTGNLMEPELAEALLRSFKGLVVIDEAYIDFAKTNSWINRLEEFPNLVVLQTFSKAWGLAGIRLGACYASKTIIDLLAKVKLPYNVNSLSQDRAYSQLMNREKVMQRVNEVCTEREVMRVALKSLDGVDEVFPSDANFLLFRCKNATAVYSELLKKGFVVRDRSHLPNCASTLRVSIGTPEQNKAFIETLKLVVTP